MDDNKILFVDLDGTLIEEDLSNLAFINYFKKYPFKCIFYLVLLPFKGKAFLKEKFLLIFMCLLMNLNLI